MPHCTAIILCVGPFFNEFERSCDSASLNNNMRLLAVFAIVVMTFTFITVLHRFLNFEC